MSPWRPQQYRTDALAANGDPEIVDNAVRTGQLLQDKTGDATPVFTLRHLAHESGVRYGFLRDVVERSIDEPYRLFRIRKKSKPNDKEVRYRIICAPSRTLLKTQRWIHDNILLAGHPHAASVAFSEESSIVTAASHHCGCKWLIKLDIVNFFESVSEQHAYFVFTGLGYQPLISFELARICTRVGKPSFARNARRWDAYSYFKSKIDPYQHELLGHLPQGAPTSPMLANLAMKEFDTEITKICRSANLTYTRYADDLTISSQDRNFSRESAKRVIHQIYTQLYRHGFSPNFAKTKIVPPGGRRVVLGLLVDGPTVRLTKEFRDKLRKHLYYLTSPSHGPNAHAEHLGFESVYGLRNHVHGLIAYAKQVDPTLAEQAWSKFNRISWP